MNFEPDTQAGAEAQKVFICYRREDTAAHAGRLYDAMVARFGERNVFMDVDIDPGVDFVERITEVVSGCLVLIVVMGPRWATVEDDDGGQRLADPDDFVRLEVETALRRPEVTPIPVLVSGARMPKREVLPEKLQPLTRRNALELSDGRWGYDVGRLNTTLDRLLDEDAETGMDPVPTPLPDPTPTPTPMPVPASDPTPTPAPAPRAAPPAAPPPPPAQASKGSALDWRLILEGAAVACVAAVLGRLLIDIPDLSEHGDSNKIIAVIVRRGVTWALVGVALAVWLGIRTGRRDLPRLGLIGLLIGVSAGALGGVIWGARVKLPDPDFKADSHVANTIQILALGLTGGLVGGLLGWIWRPPRIAAGLASGIAAAVLFQLLLNLLDWNAFHQPGNAFNFGLAAAAVTGLSLAIMLSLNHQRARAAAPVSASAAEP